MSDLQNKFHTLLPQLNFDPVDIDVACKGRLDRFTFGNTTATPTVTTIHQTPPSPPLSAGGSPRSSKQDIMIPMMLKPTQQQAVNHYMPPSPTATPAHNVPTAISTKRRRRHVCKTCTMAFATAGHLSRHNRIHTGEKNHTCPHDGCGQKFSRHDNCIQHYRTHLRKKSRK